MGDALLLRRLALCASRGWAPAALQHARPRVPFVSAAWSRPGGAARGYIAALDRPEWHCYYLLGLEKGATLDQVKKRYLILAKELHPDSAANKDDPAAKQKFAEASEAYEVLCQSIGTVQPKKLDWKKSRRKGDSNMRPATGGVKAAVSKVAAKKVAAKKAKAQVTLLITSGMWWKQSFP